MKRPEGFDSDPTPPAAAVDEPPKRAARAARALGSRFWRRASVDRASVDPASVYPASASSASSARPVALAPTAVPTGSARPPRLAVSEGSAAVAERRARADLRRAARSRRRYERAEMRRFTRRSRRRRITWLVSGAIVLTMLALVAVAVYSPLLALREIRVDGTSRLSAPDIIDAVDGQLDTPLALLDTNEMTQQLGEFPLIRSFVTETVPPDTLIIHISERQPIGSILSSGGYSLVDPAGVEIEKSVELIPWVPLIDTGGADASSDAFTGAI